MIMFTLSPSVSQVVRNQKEKKNHFTLVETVLVIIRERELLCTSTLDNEVEGWVLKFS